MRLVVVQIGDTLSSIAKKMGVDVEEIAVQNALPSEKVVAGQTLVVPGGRSYVWMPGDTFSGVAERYGLTVETLRSSNKGIANPQPGDILELPSQQKGGVVVAGFLELTTPDQDAKNVKKFAPVSTSIGLFSQGMTSNGQIVPANDASALQAFEQTRSVPAAVFSNWIGEQFSADALRIMLQSDTEQQKYLNTLLDILDRKAYKAVIIDFEMIPGSLHTSFLIFIEQLSGYLQQRNIPLLICMMPITLNDNPNASGLASYDYSALQAYADYLIVMAYNWHWGTGRPGPIAPFMNVASSIEYALSQVPRQQLLLGLIRYAYDWLVPFQTGEVAGVIGVQDALQIAIRENIPIQFDRRSLTPWFTYQDKKGRIHELWFEDARSLQLKLQLVEYFSLAGIAPWQYEQRFPQFVPMLQDNFQSVNWL
ncbi:LysM peptidoglycan-binding domain-containing protein [Alicyclobacillus tolerans]|uniref:Spore germination protein n=1 Tax=Alicyclobacillus tolerans TaxID=90970 RepID=A0ABT9LZN6_9BACL|nr:LysM peptidoglycan-binding domain-containing protein [Alicyclobacillus tengchongensis]MDP9729734.1 spore germination protein [Alicyclobacillus tengchongensis]